MYHHASPSGQEHQSTEIKEFLEDESATARTIFVGNLDMRVTRKLLYELMIQAGPVEAIKIVPLREGMNKTHAFLRFEQASSVRYAMLVLNGVSLFRMRLSLNYSGIHKSKPLPVRPPFPPTFFELPPGFENIADAPKLQLVMAKAIPPLEYKSGYLIGGSQQRLPDPALYNAAQNVYRGEGPVQHGYGHQSASYHGSERRQLEPQNHPPQHYNASYPPAAPRSNYGYPPRHHDNHRGQGYPADNRYSGYSGESSRNQQDHRDDRQHQSRSNYGRSHSTNAPYQHQPNKRY